MKTVSALYFQDHPFKTEVDKLIKRFACGTLCLEIKITVWRIKQLESKCTGLRERLKQKIPAALFSDVVWKLKEIEESMFKDIKRKNRRKLSSLIDESIVASVSTRGESAVYNFTTLDIPDRVKSLLCLEPKFGIDVENVTLPIPTIIKDVEACLQDLVVDNVERESQGDAVNVIRAEMVNIITNYSSRPLKRRKKNRLTEDLQVARTFFKENDDVILARSDKGGATVLMYKHEYLEVMKDMLSDVSTYKRITRDPTSRFQTSANKLVDVLREEGVLKADNVKKFKTHNAVVPKLYGLRKVHKQGCKLRPVVSCIKAPSYKIAKLLHSLLSQVCQTSEYNIKNSQEFVQFVREVKLPAGYVLVSLDVVSLFTNIPKDLVIEIVENNWEKWSSLISVSKDTLIELVEF